MGKIGDLWVKLGLKKQEFDKGMNDAEKKTEGFGSKMQKIKGVGLAVWGAIGGAVLKIGKDIVNSTNQMEDKWGMFVTKAKAGWNTFIKTLHNGEWQEFFANFRKEVEAAASLKEVLDADTEIMNSIKIQKARMSDQLAQLEIDMRDQTKSYKDRADAAQRYLKMVLPIYDQEIKRVEKLKAAQYGAFFGGQASASNVNNKANQALWDMMLVEYGKSDPIIDGLAFNEIIDRVLNPDNYITPFSVNEIQHQREFHQIDELQEQLARWLVDKFNRDSGYSTTYNDVISWMIPFFKQYEQNRSGEETQALVDAVIGVDEAMAAYNEETKKVQSALNTAMKGMAADSPDTFLDEFINDLTWLDDIADDPIEIPEIDVTPIESAEEALDDFVAKWQEDQQKIAELNGMLEESIVSSMSNGLQAITDMMMGLEGASPAQVLGALLEPFAQTAITLGEMLVAQGLGIEAFKKSLESLQGGVAIAAGLGLIALGSAMKSGIQALANRGAGGSTSTGSYTGGSSAADVQNYTSELTIYVEGRISGSDIVLAGNKTLSKWRR